jgi:hypothetical protein
LVASLNDPTGTVLANAVVVPAGAGGAVNVYATDDTDLVIDINGYFAPQGTGGLSLYTVTPCRVLDSRLPTGTPPFSATRDVNVTASACGIPATAQAYVFNATVVPPGPLGFITMWPQGQTQPLAATLNATDGAVTNNMAIVPTTTGSVSVFPSAPTHLVLDIFGYLRSGTPRAHFYVPGRGLKAAVTKGNRLEVVSFSHDVYPSCIGIIPKYRRPMNVPHRDLNTLSHEISVLAHG